MKEIYDWAIIGAGPAGILSVGKLLDAGVSPEKIIWIDPEFSVGDLGKHWSNVPSNTKVKLFIDFLNGVNAFRFSDAPDFEINQLDPYQTCLLSYIVKPLQWVSDHLCQSVQTVKDKANHLALRNRTWQIDLSDQQLSAKNVVLAIGSEPKFLPYSGVESVSLRDALSSHHVSNMFTSNDTVAVFGSSHSAILVLKNLVDVGVKRIVNFYKKPLRYAVEVQNKIVFDNTGLKGHAANWAREHIDGQWPRNLERFIASEEHITQYLPECQKVVYAVGFERRHLPVISGVESVHYNVRSGIIAPGLFGIGIAFPESTIDSFGIEELSVGLWKFLNYLNRVLPLWLAYGT